MREGFTDIDVVVRSLSLEEKASLTSGADIWNTVAVDRLGVESIMVSDGPHGLRAQFDLDGDHVGLGGSVPATCFPTAAALASSWDPDLAHRIGAALAEEALYWDVSVILGPGVNIKRNPLCGRNFEYFSEDPLLAGTLGAGLVRGIQSRGIGTSVKHFAANNQETDRMRVSAEVDERTLREIYLPAFEKIVTEAKPWTVMCAYNKINGTYASEHSWLLTELLRDEWDFDGVVVSDWGAVHDRVAALRAGLDLEMPPAIGYSDAAVVDAVRSGALDEAVVDRTVRRLLKLVRRARPVRTGQHTYSQEDHHRLARQAATESAVLLKNDDQLLPLDPMAAGRVLVVGEFARTPRYQGAGSSQVNPTQVDIALDELEAQAGPDLTIDFAPGFSLESADHADRLREEAVAAAVGADVVLVFLGLPAAAESEGFDRTTLELPEEQVGLVQSLARAHTKVAVVLSGGSVVAVDGWLQQTNALLHCWLGGQASGGAMADLIFGSANPSGKLAETIPKRLQDNSSHLNFPGELGSVRYGEGVFVGYRGYDQSDLEVSFPFGFGLSYTSFDIGELQVEIHGSVADDDLEVVASASVTNTGRRQGTEVVQLYVGDPEASVARPIRELRDFARVSLEPGESARCEFVLGPRAFSFWSPRLHRWVVEAGDFVISVGSSSRDLVDSRTIALDVPSSAAPITTMSTLQEWLADPTARAAMQARLPQLQRLGEAEPGMLAMVGQMPMSTLATLGVIGLGPADLDDLHRAVQEEL